MSIFDSAKNILSSAKTAAIESTLNTALKPFLNKAISGYGEIHELNIDNKKLRARGVLCGLEDKEIEVTCADVRISEDGSRIGLHVFSSNMPFAEKALNNFAARDYEIESEVLRRGLAMIRSAF